MRKECIIPAIEAVIRFVYIQRVFLPVGLCVCNPLCVFVLQCLNRMKASSNTVQSFAPALRFLSLKPLIEIMVLTHIGYGIVHALDLGT